MKNLLFISLATLAVTSCIASNATCQECPSERRWPRPACCDIGTQFCCGPRTCCSTGQTCTNDICVTVTPVPPVPSGPHTKGELLWANFIENNTPQFPLLFDSADPNKKGAPVVVATSTNISGYDLNTGRTLWSSTLAISNVAEQVPYQSSVTGKQNVIVNVQNGIASVSVVDGSTNWIYDFNEQLQCPLLISQGVVLVGRQDSIVGLDAETGKELWRSVNHTGGGNCFLWPISRSSTLQPRFIVFDEQDNLIAYIPRTGDVVWMLANVNQSSSNGVFVTDATIITSFNEEGSGSYTAYDVTNGRVAWTYPIVNEGATPVVFGNTLFHTVTGITRQAIHAIDSTTGVDRWMYKIEYATEGYYPNVVFGFHEATHPTDPVAVINDGTFVLGVRGGQLIYNISLGMIGACPIQRSGGLLYFCSSTVTGTSGYGVFAMDETSGSIVWQMATQYMANGFAVTTASGQRLPVAAVTSGEQYIYGIANP